MSTKKLVLSYASLSKCNKICSLKNLQTSQYKLTTLIITALPPPPPLWYNEYERGLKYMTTELDHRAWGGGGGGIIGSTDCLKKTIRLFLFQKKIKNCLIYKFQACNFKQAAILTSIVSKT